jgi:hypothetical protein
MCNDYEQHVAWGDYHRATEQIELGIPTHQSESDLPRADDIRVNEIGPVMRVAGNVVELVPMTFGLPPKSPRGGPVFNFKSEGRRFGESKRCLIPASAFFEFTGKRYPKAKHRFALKDAAFMDDRRALARDRGRWSAGVHHAYHRSERRRGTIPRPTGGGATPGGLGRVALSHEARGRAAQAVAQGLA